MLKVLSFATTFYFLCVSGVSQTPISLIESTIKIAVLTENLEYFVLKEGDKIILNFEETKGKPIKEIEVLEWPSQVLFSDFKVSKIDNKIINIPKTGIYRFRFTNLAAGRRICRINIQRIPQDESSINFNTTVSWRTKNDTTFYTEKEKYLVSKDTIIHNIVDQVAKVNSSTNFNGNKTTFNFNLPKKHYFLELLSRG